MMCNYMRFGGVALDVSDDWIVRAGKVTDALERDLNDLDTLISGNEIVLSGPRGLVTSRLRI